MIAAQRHGNVWMVVRLNGDNEIVTVIKSYRQQAAAHRLIMKLYANGAT